MVVAFCVIMNIFAFGVVSTCKTSMKKKMVNLFFVNVASSDKPFLRR